MAVTNVTNAAETNVITTTDMVRAREIDLVYQFTRFRPLPVVRGIVLLPGL